MFHLNTRLVRTEEPKPQMPPASPSEKPLRVEQLIAKNPRQAQTTMLRAHDCTWPRYCIFRAKQIDFEINKLGWRFWAIAQFVAWETPLEFHFWGNSPKIPVCVKRPDLWKASWWTFAGGDSPVSWAAGGNSSGSAQPRQSGLGVKVADRQIGRDRYHGTWGTMAKNAPRHGFRICSAAPTT
jgi:hypothetical protein